MIDVRNAAASVITFVQRRKAQGDAAWEELLLSQPELHTEEPVQLLAELQKDGRDGEGNDFEQEPIPDSDEPLEWLEPTQDPNQEENLEPIASEKAGPAAKVLPEMIQSSAALPLTPKGDGKRPHRKKVEVVRTFLPPPPPPPPPLPWLDLARTSDFFVT